MSTATILIKDEVNCQIQNLELDDRKLLVKKFKYFQKDAKFQPAYKLGRWDGMIGFFGIGGNTYVSLLEQIIPILVDRGYAIEVDDKRKAVSLEFDRVSADYWGASVWPDGHRFAGEPIRLREDQVEVVNLFLENPQCLQSLATGYGKTIVTATLSKICEKYGRTITIVPNKGLVEQTEEDFINCGLDVGVYYGGRKDLGMTHTICTWQSLNILDKKAADENEVNRLTAFLQGVSTVIVDESHQASANVLKTLLTTRLANTPIRWGLTGTIPKDPLEFESIRCAIGEVINTVSANTLQEAGILSSCHVNVLQSQEWQEFKSYADELSYLVTDAARVEWMANTIATISATGNTLVLVGRIPTGKLLQQNISRILGREADNIVPFISGAVKTSKRKEEYDEIKISNDNVIVATYGVAAVGINIPRIFNLVLVEAGKSFTRVIQSIGRGIRKAEDKDHVEIYDLTASTKYAKKHLTERKRFYKEAKYNFSMQKVKI